MKRLTTWSGLAALVLCVFLLAGCKRNPTGQARQPAQVTLDYWTKVNATFANAEQQLRSGRYQSAGVFRETARAVQSLPTLNVDSQVVDWSLRVAGWCDQFAILIEQSTNPSAFVIAFLRGANGDPLGPAIEVAAAERQLFQRAQNLRQEGIRLRAQLTARYQIEFPPSAF